MLTFTSDSEALKEASLHCLFLEESAQFVEAGKTGTDKQAVREKGCVPCVLFVHCNLFCTVKQHYPGPKSNVGQYKGCSDGVNALLVSSQWKLWQRSKQTGLFTSVGFSHPMLLQQLSAKEPAPSNGGGGGGGGKAAAGGVGPVFTCELCGQSMTHAYSMQRHRRQHLTQPKSFACDVCGRRYNRRDNLLVHCRTHYS